MLLVLHVGLQRHDAQPVPGQPELTDHGRGVADALDQAGDQVGLHLTLQVGARARAEQVQRGGPCAVLEDPAARGVERDGGLDPQRAQELPARAHGDDHAPTEAVCRGGLDEQGLVGGGEVAEHPAFGEELPDAVG